LSDEQLDAVGWIGSESRMRHGVWTGAVRCPAPDGTASGRASWSRTLRRLEQRGLIVRGPGRDVRLTKPGCAAYRRWLSVKKAEAGARKAEEWQKTERRVLESELLEKRRRYEECLKHRDADLQLLGLPWPCARSALKNAYRRLAKETHPDRGGSAERFRPVDEAYDRLATLI
jgi:hypothetical protein